MYVKPEFSPAFPQRTHICHTYYAGSGKGYYQDKYILPSFYSYSNMFACQFAKKWQILNPFKITAPFISACNSAPNIPLLMTFTRKGKVLKSYMRFHLQV